MDRNKRYVAIKKAPLKPQNIWHSISDLPKKPDGPETRDEKFRRLFPWIETQPGTHWVDPEEYNNIELSTDLQQVKDKLIAEFVTPYPHEKYKLPWLPGAVLKYLVDAKMKEGMERATLIKKACDAAQMSHLAKIAKGFIKIKDENTVPMPTETKQLLREINQQKREERTSLRALHKEIKSGTVPTVPSKTKTPIYADVNRQREVCTKYPWAIVGSFRLDPDKPGGTILDIKCQLCGVARTIHLADCFQVKKCLKCKGK